MKNKSLYTMAALYAMQNELQGPIPGPTRPRVRHNKPAADLERMKKAEEKRARRKQRNLKNYKQSN